MLRKTTVLLSLIPFLAFFSSAQSNWGVTAILSPSSGCDIPYPQTVIVRYSRLSGLTAAIGVELTYTLNGVPIPTVETTNVAAGGGADYIFIFSQQIQANLVYGMNTLVACARGSTEGAGTAGDDCMTLNFMNYLPTNAGGISGATSMCAGDPPPTTLNIAGETGSIIRWEESVDAGANWTNIANTTTTYSYPSLLSTTQYRAVVKNGTCPALYTNVATIAVNQYPVVPTLGSNTPVCSGNTISLSSATVSTSPVYSWTGPNGFTSALPNPTIASSTTAMDGVYSCTITENGCTGPPGTTTVNVYQTPPAPVLSSNTPVCTGEDLTLFSVAMPGGTFDWTGPNSFNSTDDDPIIIDATIAATGTYSARATVSGCTGPYGTTSVVMNQTPNAPVAGSNSPVCENDVLNVTSTTIPGATYTWTGPAGAGVLPATQNLSFPSATTPLSGTYTVFATISGCSSLTTSTDVTVNALPAAPVMSSNSPVCSGNTLNLFSNAVAGSTYSWNGPNGFASTSQNPAIPVVTTAAAGTYSTDVTNTLTGCTSPKGTISVVIDPTPPAPTAGSNTPVCNGGTILLSASAIAGATYSWTGPNGFTSTSQNPTLTAIPAATGTYTAIATVGGCPGPPASTNVVVSNNPDAPFASSNSEICEGTNLQLIASNVSGGVYSWTGPNGFLSGSQNPVLTSATLLAAGTYSVTVDVAGCVSIAGTTDVVVNPIPAVPIPASNTPVCSGNTLNLSANNIVGATYSWTGPNSFTANSQNPSIANVTTAGSGTYSVIASVKGCASAAGTTNVVINATPTAPFAASNSALCSGDNLNLSASGAAGATYDWSGPGGFTSSIQNPSILGVTSANAGTYFVTATVSGCTGPAGLTSVTINTIPPAPTIASNSPVCSGSFINLTSSSVTGATYNWTGPNAFTSTFQNPSIANADPTLHPGLYYVVASVGGCTGPSSSVNVSVVTSPAPPTASSNSPLCVGSTLNLSASGPAAASYSWTGPNGYSSTTQNPSFVTASSSESGTYFVSAVVGSCASPTTSVEVNIYPIPAAPTPTSNSPVCSGTTLTLDASPVAGAIYTWSGPNGFSSFQQNPTINNIPMTGAGSYDVFVTVNSCQSATASTSVTINQTPPAPLAGSNSPLCESADLNLTASTITGASYMWNGPNSYTSTFQNPTITNVTAADAGSYFVTATVGACTGPAGLAPVSISAAPSTPTAGNNGPICEGGTVQLTANDIVGAVYNWTGPNGFTSSQQNPVIPNVTIAAAGVYSVVATVGGGCTGPAGSTNLTVNPTPAAPVAGVNGPICSGSDLLLTASTVPGASYSWTGPNLFTSTSQNPSIIAASAAATGTYYVQTTSGGCSSLPVSVQAVVYQTPATPVLSSNGPLCANGTLQLTASAIPGVIYSWSGPNGFTSSLQNPSIPNVTSAATGIYSVTVTEGNGCGSPPTNLAVTVNPAPAAPVAASNSPICSATDLNFTATTVAGATYSWSGPNSFSSTLQSPSIAAASISATGTYIVQTFAGGCSSDPVMLSVIVNPTPSAPIASAVGTVCQGSTINLNASSIPGANYTWSGPGSYSSSTQNPVITGATPSHSGSYSVFASVDGCDGPTNSVNVTVNPTTVGGSVAASATVCEGDNGGTITLSGHSGSVSNWLSSTDGGSTWVTLENNTLSQNYSNLTETTMYRVAVQSGVCPSAFSGSATITVIPQAVGGTLINTNAAPALCYGDNEGIMTLINYTGTIAQWEMTTDGGVTWDTIPHTSDTLSYHNLIENTSYRVLLLGCTTTAYSEAEVMAVSTEACYGGLVIATLVTPNGDNNNDLWLIGNTEDFPPLEVMIANRYGTLVYENADYQNNWDCTFNGDLLPDGTYYYVIKVSGTGTVYKGNINIMR